MKVTSPISAVRAADSCSIDAVFRVIGGRWKPRLLWHLLPGLAATEISGVT